MVLSRVRAGVCAEEGKASGSRSSQKEPPGWKPLSSSFTPWKPFSSSTFTLENSCSSPGSLSYTEMVLRLEARRVQKTFDKRPQHSNTKVLTSLVLCNIICTVFCTSISFSQICICLATAIIFVAARITLEFCRSCCISTVIST